MSLEHEIKGSRLGELATLSLLRTLSIRQLILPESSFANDAVNKWIAEIGEVSARFEHLRRSKNRRVNEHHIIPFLDHGSNPGVLDVAQH